MKRTTACILVLILLAGWACALADNGSWDCPSCGKTGNTGNFCPNCAFPRPESGTVDNHLEQIPGETDRVKVRLSGVSATSYIVNKQDPTSWLPVHAADGDESTCWQFSSKNGALGKTFLTLNLPAAQTVDALWFKNGFWGYTADGKDKYTRNARPKAVRAEFLYQGKSAYKDPIRLTLKDDKTRKDWQRFEIGRHADVIAIRLCILSAYPGSKYANDVCLTEVMLVQNASASLAQPAQAGLPSSAYVSPSSASAAKLLMKLSTRSGPSTRYDEPGTFFGKNWQTTTVKVLAKEWDGNIWWVLVDFQSGGSKYRVWTGLKRVDVNLDLLPEYYSSGQGTVDPTETRRGPGGNYAKGPKITHWQDVVAYGRENGYVEVEYYDEAKDRLYRVWVPASAASID